MAPRMTEDDAMFKFIWMKQWLAARMRRARRSEQADDPLAHPAISAMGERQLADLPMAALRARGARCRPAAAGCG